MGVVPQYIQDLETGAFGEIIETEGDEHFAYFINPETGLANGTRGSINFEVGDSDIEYMTETMCNRIYTKLKKLRKSKMT